MFPQSSYQFSHKSIKNFEQESTKGSFIASNVDERRKSLQSYLQELTLIPVVKESMQFKLFLGIKAKFPEYVDGY